jgi:hypothetical protein
MLPSHRRDVHRDPGTAPTHKSPRYPIVRERLVPFVIDWIKVSWRDILTMAILGAATLGVRPCPSSVWLLPVYGTRPLTHKLDLPRTVRCDTKLSHNIRHLG